METKRKTIKLLETWGRHKKGAVIDLNEPAADTLIRVGIAEAYGGGLSLSGTKTIDRKKVAAKGA